MSITWELFISSSAITSEKLYWDIYDVKVTADSVFVSESGKQV